MKKNLNLRKAVLLFTIGGIFLFFTGVFLGQLHLFENKTIGEEVGSVDNIISYNENLSITKEIFDNCSSEKMPSDKFFCVNKFLSDNYTEVPRENVYSIDEMFEKGADCKSFSVYYATFAKMFGYDYAFFITPDHIATLVYFNGGYCLLDQKLANCVYYKDLNISLVELK